MSKPQSQPPPAQPSSTPPLELLEPLQTKRTSVVLRLLPGQREAIIAHYHDQFGFTALSQAVRQAVINDTRVPLPAPSSPTGGTPAKRDLLIFKIEHKKGCPTETIPLFNGKPQTRVTAQGLLGISKQAVFLMVKDIRKDGHAIRDGYVFKLSA